MRPRRLRVGLAIGVVVVVGGVIAAVCYYRPLLAVRDLKHALQARNPAGVALRVDFPTLKANSKRYREAQLEEKNDGKFLEGLRNWIGKGLVDDAVDNAGTPEGLIRLVCDGKTDGEPTPAGTPCPLNGHLVDYGYIDDNRFRVIVGMPSGKGLGMVMSRTGGITRWRLVQLFDAKTKPDAGRPS